MKFFNESKEKNKILAWLERDLFQSNTDNQRRFIIVFTSQSFYCSKYSNLCENFRENLHIIETLFYEYEVDLVIQSNSEFYER